MKKLICEFLLNKSYDLNGPIVLRVANAQNILKQRTNKIMGIAAKYKLFDLTVAIDIIQDDRLKCSFYADDLAVRLKKDDEIEELINTLIIIFDGIFEQEEQSYTLFEFNEEISVENKKEYCKKLIKFYQKSNEKEYINNLKKYINEISK